MGINDIGMYRQLLLTDQKAGRQTLDHLAKTDYRQFLVVCDRLLADESEVSVRRAVFSLLGQKGSQDALVEMKALEALNVPELQQVALFALGKVASPKSYPLLFMYAQQGIPEAISALNRLPLSEKDQERLVKLARTFLFAQDYDVLDASLRVLLHFSNVPTEEKLLLQAAQQHYNENVVGALEEATSVAIPGLQAMLQSLPKNSVEFKYVEHALDRIKQRYGLEESSDT